MSAGVSDVGMDVNPMAELAGKVGALQARVEDLQRRVDAAIAEQRAFAASVRRGRRVMVVPLNDPLE